MSAKLKLYGAIGLGVVAAIVAFSVWWTARDERLRLEGEHRAEVQALRRAADSVVAAYQADSAERARADSVSRAALRDSLRIARERGVVSLAAADSARERGDSLMQVLATDSTARDSLRTMGEAISARTREAMNARAAEMAATSRAEIAERGIARLEAELDSVRADHAAAVALISQLNEKLGQPNTKPKGIFARAWGIARDGLAVIGAVAIVVVGATLAR